MNAKTIAKTAGKIALTAVVPPIGLATFAKTNGDRVRAGVLGAVASAVSTLFGFAGYDGIQNNVLSNSPNIHIRNYSFPELEVAYFSPESMISPIWAITRLKPYTELVNEDRRCKIEGRDVINFTNSNLSGSAYTLNFGKDRKFVGSQGLVSLAEAQKDMLDALSHGDIPSAQKATAKYEIVSKEYDSARSLFENAVAKMNSDLAELNKRSMK